MTDYQQAWAEARDRLTAALQAQGYPAELGEIMEKQLRTPKVMDRMTSYIQHGYARNMEMLADEMFAICADTDSWREKKENPKVQAKYNSYLYYRRRQNDEDE